MFDHFAGIQYVKQLCASEFSAVEMELSSKYDLSLLSNKSGFCENILCALSYLLLKSVYLGIYTFSCGVCKYLQFSPDTLLVL